MPDNSAIQNPLGRIKEICKNKKWTVYKLAQESGVAYSSLNNMFNRNTQPTLPTLINLCRGLNISLSDFFADCDLDIVPINDECRELIKEYKLLSSHKRELVRAYVKGLLDGDIAEQLCEDK